MRERERGGIIGREKGGGGGGGDKKKGNGGKGWERSAITNPNK